MEETILNEISQGNYVIVQDIPTIVSALDAIAKPESSAVRLIHNCSMPKRKGFKSYSEVNYFKLQILDDALRLIKPEISLYAVVIYPSNNNRDWH